MVNAHRVLAIIAALTVGSVVLAGCSNGGKGPSDAKNSQSVPDKSESVASSQPSPEDTPSQQVTLSCAMDKEFHTRKTLTVTTNEKGMPDFALTWAVRPYSCEADRSNAPFSPLEEAAFAASKYQKRDITSLYTICAAVNPDDVYAGAEFTPSVDQVSEINAALVLCPGHPQANAWRQAVQRGKAKSDLKAAGQVFGPGTFLVGKEIRPGVYVVEGDIKGCYWERQNSSGGTIENNFIPGARRVEVTISANDYAFHSEGCGEWTPAH